MRFGISSHLYHDRPLSQEHLAEIASHGFEVVELFATRSHFDYHDPAAIATLRRWLTTPVEHVREVRTEFLLKLADTQLVEAKTA